ncbi:MAG TPA: hypothetical protein VMX17_01235 [Candidatus Glassbacteria bacterium]|nr:hypothetical protein [Candidatus Glassbacteria bacterium]
MLKRKALIPQLDMSDAEKEWVGMPEFVQKENPPFREIKIRFTCEEDVQEFAEKIGHTVTSKTTYIWYSEVPFKGRNVKRRYIDES